MSSYRYRFVGYEKLPSGLNADDVQLHCRLPDELISEIRNSGYGRLLRSVFLCDYFTNDVFRREIHTLLNRGESVHLLQRAIYYGRITAERGRRRDELKSISGSHALLTNVVIGWNTMKLQETVDRLKSSGQRIDDSILRRIGPVHFGHINFRGTMSFSVARYASVLLKGEMASKRAPAKRAEK